MTTGLLPETVAEQTPRHDERADAERQVEGMQASRTSMVPWWSELSRYFSPRSARIQGRQDNRGNVLNRHLINEKAVFAKRALAAMLSWGITNPSQRWRQLAVPDVTLQEDASVAEWLHVVNERMNTSLGQSNFYHAMTQIYDDVIVYGTAAILMEDDADDLFRFVPFATGSYSLADDEKQRVTAYSRTLWMTVRQIMKRFGTDDRGREDHATFSKPLLDAIKDNALETRIEVVQLVYPNPEYDGVKRTPEYKQFASCYYEAGAYPKDARYAFLAKEGYDEWPLMVFRWRRVADEVYGIDAPGMQVLGTNKSLQQVESKKLKLLDKAVDPPMVGPDMGARRPSMLPGDYNAVNDRDKQMRALHDVNLAGLAAVQQERMDMEARVDEAFYTNLMLFISNATDPRDRTAREVDEISNEKYLVLGTVLESFNETFEAVTDRQFAMMLRAGMIPEAPELLQGVTLKVEYTSIMAQAQKSVGLTNLKDFAYTVAAIAKETADPRLLRKVDFAQWVDEFAQRSSIPPSIVYSDEVFEANERAAAELAAEERRVALAAEEADATAKLGATPMGGDTALDRVVAAGGMRGLPA